MLRGVPWVHLAGGYLLGARMDVGTIDLGEYVRCPIDKGTYAACIF